MTANRINPVLLAAALAALFSSAADAGDRRHGRDHRHHRVENSRWDRQGDGRWNRPPEIDRMGGFVDRWIRRSRSTGGFYGGSIQAYSVPGHGVYFVRDADYWPLRGEERIAPAPKAKVIDVEKEMGGNVSASPTACAFEAGVCIIRGSN